MLKGSDGALQKRRCANAPASARQCPVDRRPADAQRLGDSSWADALRFECTHLGHVYARFATLVDAFSLCLGDTFQLTFLAQGRLELR